ncbi:hypothetical protein BOQ63_012430 [Streptomyces viridifaciens]|nr:hypothetical protein BOQ63_012430 [Streptomyces viridifaciens]
MDTARARGRHGVLAPGALQLGPFTFGVTGWAIIGPDINSRAQYTADSLSPCRGIALGVTFTGHVEASWPAGAQFEIGYAVQVDAGTAAARRMVGRLGSAVPAGLEEFTFTTHQAAVYAPHVGGTLTAYPAVRVVSGTLNVNSWVTEMMINVTTR